MDEPISERERNQFFALMDAVAPRLVWEAFAVLHERQSKLEQFDETLTDLEQIIGKARSGALADGDTFKAMRLLAGFSKTELIRMIIALGSPDDDGAGSNWRIDLVRRKPSRFQKLMAKAEKKIASQEIKRERELEVVQRVIRLRIEDKCTVEEAIEKVASCQDYPAIGAGSAALPKKVRSISAVRADYIAGMNWIGPAGYVEIRTGGLFSGRLQSLHFEPLRKKGRRPKKRLEE
jgi:hypothetical protein